SSADEIALAGARKLNDQDRIGQMNNMVARNRQLVYSSRRQLDDVTSDYPQMEDLAQQLLDESVDSADEIESQRKHLHQVARTEALKAMQDKFDRLKGSYPMSLPWMVVGAPQLSFRHLGKIARVESNVNELKNIEQLEEYDNSQSYI